MPFIIERSFFPVKGSEDQNWRLDVGKAMDLQRPLTGMKKSRQKWRLRWRWPYYFAFRRREAIMKPAAATVAEERATKAIIAAVSLELMMVPRLEVAPSP